jgi:hypothetical protein
VQLYGHLISCVCTTLSKQGAAEEIGYDTDNHYLYTASEQGYVVIIDYADPLNPILTEFSFDLTSKDSDLASLEVTTLT